MNRSSGDYYKILEVPPGANLTEIKKVYRRLALQYHPDRHDGDPDKEERLKVINEAYSVLSGQKERGAPAQREKKSGEGLRRIFHWEYDLFRAQILLSANKVLSLSEGPYGGVEKLAAHCREAVEKDPDGYNAHFILGVYYRQRSRFKDSLASFREALRIRPYDVEACLNLAITCEAVRDAKGAIKSLLSARALLKKLGDIRRLSACEKSLEIMKQRYSQWAKAK